MYMCITVKAQGEEEIKNKGDFAMKLMGYKRENGTYGIRTVSYTHLDVYKRQGYISCKRRTFTAD